MHKALAFAFGLLLAAQVPGHAHQIEIRPSKDNTLYENSLGSLSNGQGEFIFTGRTGPFANGESRRAVVAFDVAGNIPAGATIDAVELVLTCDKAPPVSGATTVEIHRLVADWGEGPSQAFAPEGQGTAAGPGDATWVHTFFSANLWANAGGDFVAAPSAATQVDQPAVYTWTSTAQMVADVQDWLDNPNTNFGWILIGDESVDHTARRFSSVQNLIPSDAPILRVHFTAIPATTYCTAKVNSLGCTPAIGFTGRASASAGAGFVIDANLVLNNKNGLLFYSKAGPGGGPFLGGTLCANTPVRRTPPSSSGGNPPPNDCSGLLTLDFNAWISSGADPALVSGQQVWTQWYYRDPGASFSVGLSDGLTVVIGL
jgi:hypothetical protein